MTRKECLIKYWEYYLYLEKDFLQLIRYISLYKENFYTFSDEIHKQLISVGIEFENISKKLCEIKGISLSGKTNVTDFKQWIPTEQIEIKVIYSFEQINLLPFDNFTKEWWKSYNDIKHNRNANYKKVNFKNLLDALAGLFYAEMSLIKIVGKINDDIDVPDKYSKLFRIKDWETKYHTIQPGARSATNEEIDNM